MKIKLLGHACFLITSDSGTRIITDPYYTGGPLCYEEINETADIVTVSHDHKDHNNYPAVKGNPRVIASGNAEVKGIKITGIPTFHDAESGKKRGNNVVFCFDIDGIRLCHFGDLGHDLSDKQIAELGRVDVLMTPMAGNYAIDAALASRLVERIKPRVVFPMHYRNEKCGYPITGIDDFLKGKKNVRLVASSEIELKAGKLPDSTEVVVLKPAL